ncbi:molybdenum cofactor guanylyltransferase [Sphaerobacter thermophilus]|uniref:Probable molybdenum cofactor guanylyltransferase n=1 Tax=Sphaerobacter thermophilus (strain ATCC 49802 / DSM 20745 / KCCM 41009 / NCIMB 13125 / S 6022) TaxID=479434 RepID=D1C2I5_SPHTD|nr:molybdenum cofactor guanylyltransferase [Sphaerobacter thermophilus]ACZ38452.1 molybdopterin-guanine dinucleotide biosynthesis MobB region containing protein [Sphaerobacter thermophilus DSM 20745]
MTALEPLSVAILAGGQSRRMGRDKALLDVAGRALIEHVIERARPVASEMMLIASDRPAYARFGLRVVPDRCPQSGALGGIYTAIAEAEHPHCLVLACDMPFVNTDLLRYMAAVPRDYDVLVPSLAAERSTQGERETLETLHAIYGKSCLPAIERQLQEGILKVIGFFSQVRVKRIPEEEIRQYDPNLLSFYNANTPEEYEWVRRRYAAGDGRGEAGDPVGGSPE